MQKKRAAEKTVCSEGHPLTEDNVYVRPSDGVRTCRICRSDRDVANRKKNRDAINARKRAWRQKWRAQGIRK